MRCLSRSRFQFTPLREGRRRAAREGGEHRLFQFTPLREGRPIKKNEDFELTGFQFTPLREGRPPKVVEVRRRGFIFQFTPLREGRRPGVIANSIKLRNFNSRPCERGDPTSGDKLVYPTISIHAPARGATENKPMWKT